MDTKIYNCLKKYIGVNLTRDVKLVQDLYAENYKLLMKEIKIDIDTRRNMQCSWIG